MFGKKKEADVDIQPSQQCVVSEVGRTIRVQDVLNFFTHDANPAYFDSRLEEEKIRQSQGQRGVPWNWIIALGLLLLFGSIAYSIINGQFQQNSAIEALKNIALAQSKVVTGTSGTSSIPA